MSSTTYPAIGKDSMGNEITVDRTERTARKEHPCSRCSLMARRAGFPNHARRIDAGERYVESYGLGEPFHPARYHLTCWDEEMAE